MTSLHRYINGSEALGAAYARVGRHAPGFDTLRIAAASLVVFHHSLALEYDIVREDPLFAWSQEYTTIGFLPVCAFFCISGFLVTPGLVKNSDVVGYLSRRFMRIMPLLVVVVLATVFIVGPIATRLPLDQYFADARTWLYLKNVTTSLSLVLPGAVNQMGGDEVNSALWTLRFEWLCYLMLAGLAMLRLLTSRIAVLVLWLAATAIAFGTYRGQMVAHGQFEVLAHLFAYFGAGTLLYLFREHVPVSPLLAVLALLGLLAVWAAGLGALFAPALTAYLVVTLGLVRWPWSALLARGDVSYGLYLLHGPSIVLVLAFWTPPSFLHLFFAVMSLSLSLSVVSWQLLEKPALAHKGLPAKIFYSALQRLGWTSRKEPN